ncbi:hypothetical protein [Maribacter sp.]|uniref:hypothetical protein n=1 Tax=Maribacter sp. TaxID=1897614 RepID=UPI0025C159A0|nr:hypothetical protein [Maribacter sp.]
MKNLIKVIFTLCLMNFSLIKAQIPVTDVANGVTNVTNMLQTLETMWNTYDQLEEVREGVKKLQSVNEKVKQAKLVLAIAENVEDVGGIMRELPREIAKIKNPEIRNVTQDVVDIRLQELSVFKDLFTSSMTSNFFEGGDFERLTFLTEVYRESIKLRASMAKLSRTVQRASY